MIQDVKELVAKNAVVDVILIVMVVTVFVN